MKTRIRLNEHELKKLISSVVDEIISGGLPKKDQTGDIYWAALQGKPYIIEEGLIKTYPTKDVVNALEKLFDFYGGDDFTARNKILYALDQFEKCDYNGTIECTGSKNKTERIEIKVNANDYNQTDFDKYLLKYGWFCGYVENIFGYSNIVRFIYEKKFDIEVTDIVNDKDYIYHICPNIYLTRINLKGLVPRFSSWNTFKNPERVYFFLNELSHDEFVQWTQHFKKGKKIHTGSNGWSLLKIDVGQLKNNPNFYFDPRMKGGIYTMDSISPEAIEIIDYIKYEK